MKKLILFAVMAASAINAMAQKPEDTEIYTPVPNVVTPGKNLGDAPSDAIVLFDGKNLDKWVITNDHNKPADWIVKDGILTDRKSVV